MFDGKYSIKIFGAIVFVLFYATALVYLAYNSISHAKRNLWKKISKSNYAKHIKEAYKQNLEYKKETFNKKKIFFL